MVTDDFISVPEFAKRLGVGAAAVYTAIQNKRVLSAKILGRIAIPASELERFKRRRNGKQSKVLKKAA